MKRERIDFLADNPLYTRRFAQYVGKRCQSSTIKDIAKELRLNWHTVKDLDKDYMKALLLKTGTPASSMIGVDEISIHKGHCRERSRTPTPYLVRRNRPVDQEHGFVLRVAWAEKIQ